MAPRTGGPVVVMWWEVTVVVPGILISVMEWERESPSKSTQIQQVTQFHITNWSPDGVCTNLATITDVIEEVDKVQRRTGNQPIVVHCSDTVERSGMFCAITMVTQQCKTEGVMDVFQTVKSIRTQKPGAVLTVDQYQSIFKTMVVLLDQFDQYSNFR
ncbi:hypothetical protein EMCRGX_G019004 [Ephydatia muelleri]|eukprot:Em0011g1045a